MMNRSRLPLALTAALPLALALPACGNFDGHDDRVFDFPAQAAPPVPHPAPYEPEPPEPQPTPEAPTEVAERAPLAEAAVSAPRAEPARDAPQVVEAPALPEPEAISPSDEGGGRHRPPFDAPRKNVGMKPEARKLRRPAADERAEARAADKAAAFEELRHDRLRPSGARLPPRAMGERPVKRSALSSARDGD